MPTVDSQYKLEMKVEDIPFPLHSSMLESLTIVESINMLAPSFNLKLEDKGLNLLERLPLVGEELIEFRIGRESFDDLKITFKNMGWNSYRESGPEQFSRKIGISGLLNEVFSLISPTRNKAFRDVEGSEVAGDIANLTGITTVNVEETDNKQTWLQPNWTDAQMLRDLSKRCISKTYGSGGYLYYLDRDSFNFISVDKAIRGNQVAELTYQTAPGKIDPETEILDYASHGNSSVALTGGGYGVTAAYYDFNEKTFLTRQIKPSDERQNSLGDKLAVRSSNESVDNRLFNVGRLDSNSNDNVIVGAADSVLLNRLNSLMKMEVLVLGKDIYRPGKTVKLYIPSIDDRWVFDSTVSGKWLIETVSHHVTSMSYLCKLILVRSGATLRENIPSLVNSRGRIN